MASKKQLLKERFQELAGIKSMEEINLDENPNTANVQKAFDDLTAANIALREALNPLKINYTNSEAVNMVDKGLSNLALELEKKLGINVRYK